MGNLLVATDGSDAATRALRHAARQAVGAPGTRLVVVTVLPSVRAYGEIDVYVGRDRMRDLAAEQARTALARASEQLADLNAPFDTELCEGDPAETIVRRAAESGCDAIIMGTRGLGRVGAALLGSVAQQVIHLSPVPVTLVK